MANQWIKTEDELPPVNREVLFAVRYDGESEVLTYWGYRDSKSWVCNCADDYGWMEISGEVVAWMPLPDYLPDESVNNG